MVYTYDIFDTILYRDVPKSVDVFEKLQNVLEQEGVFSFKEKIFSDCRRKCEFWLRRRSRKEITIYEIYRCLCKKMGISEKNVQVLIDTELEVEIQSTFLNQQIVLEIKKHLKNNEKVLLISDMYWPEMFIRKWLVQKDEVFNNIPIYISCDYNASKKHGDLFEIVKCNEGLEESEWIHTGDNKVSDGSIPEKLGIKSRVIYPGVRYKFEKKLDGKNTNLMKAYSVVTHARQQGNGEEYDLGVSVAGPMVYQYVLWVLEESQKAGIETLYFVLRDGYILKKVADEIIFQRNLAIKTEYLFGSRVAWRFPEVTIEKLKALNVWEKSNWIFRDPAYGFVPFERLGFSKEELKTFIESDFVNSKLETFKEFKDLLECCLENETFCNKLENNIKEAGENLKLYLMQTLANDKNIALVDTNSTGKTQKDLNEFIKKNNCRLKKLKFFYHTYLSNEPIDSQTQFVFIDAKEQDIRFPEALFRAPYNPCYGYQIDHNGQAIPRFQEGIQCAWNGRFNYDAYLEGILMFVKTVEKNEKIDWDPYVSFLMRVVNFEIISQDLIQQMAKIPFNPDLNGEENLDFYPKLNWKALLHPFSELIYYPKGSFYLSGGLWIQLYKLLYYMVKLKRGK